MVEFYVGPLNEAVRKEKKEAKSPLEFWDYCVESRARVHSLSAKNAFKFHGSNTYVLLAGKKEDTQPVPTWMV